MKRKVVIVGTVGLPASYGGFETLVENLVDYNGDIYNYIVICSSKHYREKINEYKGAELQYINVNANGINSIIYDTLSLIKCLFIKPEVTLILGVSGCLFLPIYKLFSSSKIIINIDGLEWRREKWKGIAKKFLKLSEYFAIHFADLIIADNKSICEYVESEYNIKSNLIAYGGDHALHEVQERDNEDEYYLSICRIEPENNVHLILDAFDHCGEKIKFIGNWGNSKYGKDLKSKYTNKKNIQLIDPIYEHDILAIFRSNCQAYIHGHSAGGTNPSLVEMMHFSKTVIAYDCNFNKNTTENSALYFSDVEELTKILSNNIPDNIGVKMKEIAQRKYCWKKIAQEYELAYSSVIFEHEVETTSINS